MHEMAYVRNVVDTVNKYAEKENVAEVKAVYLTTGMSRDIVEEYFQGLFQFLARGTVAEHAEIVIRRLPLTVKCNQCGMIFPLNVRDESTWHCPACKAEHDYKVHTGMEFTIDRIDVRAKDEQGLAQEGQPAQGQPQEEKAAE